MLFLLVLLKPVSDACHNGGQNLFRLLVKPFGRTQDESEGIVKDNMSNTLGGESVRRKKRC
jgi:hypothetical protein